VIISVISSVGLLLVLLMMFGKNISDVQMRESVEEAMMEMRRTAAGEEGEGQITFNKFWIAKDDNDWL